MPIDFSPHVMTAASTPSPYVASASTEFTGLTAFKAFDNTYNAAHYWIGTNHGTDWLKIDIGAGRTKVLGSYAIRVNSIPEATRAPKDWTLEGSNDNSSWDTLDTVTNQASWGSAEIRTFTCDVITTAYRYFRLNITANNGDANYTQVGELHLYESIPATDFAPHYLLDANDGPYVVSDSSHFTGAGNYEGWKCFDGILAGGNTSWIGIGNGVDWLKLDINYGGLGSTKILGSYHIIADDVSAATRAPKNWTMEGSNDNSNWDTLDTVTNSTGWGIGEGRTFTCDVVTTAYRYFRLNISANNGDADYTQIAEVIFYESSTVALTEDLSDNLGDLADDLIIGFVDYHLGLSDDLHQWADGPAPEFPLVQENADSLTLSDALIYWYLIWDFIIEPTGADSLDFWKDGFSLELSDGQIDLSIEDMDFPDKDFLEISLSQWLLALSVEGYDTLQYELWDTVEIKVVSGKSFFDSLSFADALSLRLDWTFGEDDSLDLSDDYNDVEDGSIVPDGDTMSLSDELIVNSLIDSAFDLGDSFELSDSLDVPILSKSITSYLRRYLNDVVRS